MEEKCTKPVEEIKWVDQWWCDETTVNIKHNKTMPQCHNVTKQNCVTKWEMDDQARMIKYHLPIAMNTSLKDAPRCPSFIGASWGIYLGRVLRTQPSSSWISVSLCQDIMEILSLCTWMEIMIQECKNLRFDLIRLYDSRATSIGLETRIVSQWHGRSAHFRTSRSTLKSQKSTVIQKTCRRYPTATESRSTQRSRGPLWNVR